MRNRLKFKKLLNEYRSLKFELEFIEDVLSEYHHKFEDTYRKYCVDNNIDLDSLHNNNKDRVERLFPEVLVEKESKQVVENKPEQTKHKSIYRELAKKLHPDSLPKGDERYDEYKEAFQRATHAHDNGAWGDLFDLVEHYDINLRNYASICNSLVKDIKEIKKKIENQKKTFSWALYECEDKQDCTERVIKNFLHAVFRYRV
jgi:dGTP triphosphohydrolase